MTTTPLSSLTLDEWYRIMGIHPWHGFQLSNEVIPLDSKCNTITCERAWIDAQRVGRYEIRAAIQRAEEIAYQYLHYWPFRRHNTLTIDYPTMGNRTLTRSYDVDPQGRWVSIQLPEGHVHALGSLYESTPVTASVVYADLDGDTLYETAQITASVPLGTLPSEVVVQFTSIDLGALPSSPDIPVRKVTVNGTTATIVIDAWNMVCPLKYQGVTCNPLNPNSFYTASSFAPTPNAYVLAYQVSVFRRRTDPTGTTQDTAQAVFIWESEPYPYFSRCCYNFSSLQTRDPSGLRYAIARGGVRDSRAGIIYLGESVYDPDSQTWSGRVNWQTCRQPDRVIVRYEAGSTENHWKTVIARLAAAELTRPICACTSANKELAEWQWDLSRNGGTDEVYSSPGDLTNPIGGRRGHIYAWRTLQQLQRTVGFLAG